jgi:penicillin V acylase-like amidase (Ntn superfamily)
MCTAATYKTKDFYFGRTLDYEFSYGDQIVITPRNYAFNFRHVGDMKNHYAIIGMAHVAEDYPLYYDAMNEKGVAIAGLNFVGNAVYAAIKPDVENIAQFEFIPWILSQCSSLVEVRELLERINIVNTPFSEQLPLAQLHWIISDENESITVESMSDGLHIYDNPVGVLTKNPQRNKMENLKKYTNVFTETFDIKEENTKGLKYQDIEAWDSVGHMGLIAALEDSFGIMLDPDDIVDLSSFEKGQEILSKYEIKFSILF